MHPNYRSRLYLCFGSMGLGPMVLEALKDQSRKCSSLRMFLSSRLRRFNNIWKEDSGASNEDFVLYRPDILYSHRMTLRLLFCICNLQVW